MAPIYAKSKTKSAQDLHREPQAMAIGERLLADNCAPCHGSDAKGGKGFPNLTDQDWLWGGSETIELTITNGRIGTTPPMAAAIGGPRRCAKCCQLCVEPVGQPAQLDCGATGKPKFVACAACHGMDGKEQPGARFGEPDRQGLAGRRGEDAIVAMVNNGKTNVMPAQGGRLSAEHIHVLAAYVWGLSQSAAAVASK